MTTTLTQGDNLISDSVEMNGTPLVSSYFHGFLEAVYYKHVYHFIFAYCLGSKMQAFGWSSTMGNEFLEKEDNIRYWDENMHTFFEKGCESKAFKSFADDADVSINAQIWQLFKITPKLFSSSSIEEKINYIRVHYNEFENYYNDSQNEKNKLFFKPKSEKDNDNKPNKNNSWIQIISA